jgi:hypothetical protein
MVITYKRPVPFAVVRSDPAIVILDPVEPGKRARVGLQLVKDLIDEIYHEKTDDGKPVDLDGKRAVDIVSDVYELADYYLAEGVDDAEKKKV